MKELWEPVLTPKECGMPFLHVPTILHRAAFKHGVKWT